MPPAEFGGGAADFLTFCLAVEEVARVDLSLSWTVAVAPAGAQMIAFLGTPEQKAMWTEQWLKPVVRGEAVTAAAITEPDAGSPILPPYRKMGLRPCDPRELAFEDCRVPAVNRIGSPGGGRGRIIRGFFTARIAPAPTAPGPAAEGPGDAPPHPQ